MTTKIYPYPRKDNPSVIDVEPSKFSQRAVDIGEIILKKKTDIGIDYISLTQAEMFDLLQIGIFRATTGKIKSEKFLDVIEQIMSYLYAKGAI